MPYGYYRSMMVMTPATTAAIRNLGVMEGVLISLSCDLLISCLLSFLGNLGWICVRVRGKGGLGIIKGLKSSISCSIDLYGESKTIFPSYKKQEKACYIITLVIRWALIQRMLTYIF